MEQSASVATPSSWVYDLLRSSFLPALLRRLSLPVRDAAGRFLSAAAPFGGVRAQMNPDGIVDRVYNTAVVLVVAGLLLLAIHFIATTVGLGEVATVFRLGLATMGRVFLLLLVATLLWTPIGVAIGLNPSLARAMQPVVQFLASFPANVLFPFATMVFISWNIPINWGCILLMALGAQWYILFNTIAGAQTIPTELREMVDDLEVKGWLRWRRLIIPAIFSSWVTGAITASGGAWNASIVSEVVSWGAATLTATGLGSYIADATSKGDWPRVTLGIGMMSMFVVGVNVTVWRRLYRYAEERFAR
jgi:NitT/TauT family transport system permease protein